MFSLARNTAPLAAKFRPFLAPSLFRSIATEAASSPATEVASSPGAFTPKARPQKPYMIHRSATGNLPVYQEIRAGGSKKQTRIRKIEGDAKVLRDELTEELGIKKEECVWHQLTNNVVLKGHRRLELLEVLAAKGF